MGSVTAFSLVKQHSTIEEILKTAVPKDKVPTTFPYEEARELFKNHPVPDVTEIDADTGKKKYDFRAFFAAKPKPDREGNIIYFRV